MDAYSPKYGKYMGIIGLEPYSFEILMGSEWDTTSSGVNQQDAQGCGPPVVFVGLWTPLYNHYSILYNPLSLLLKRHPKWQVNMVIYFYY